MELKRIKTVVFDLDGTIYYGTKMAPKANEVIQSFRNQGKRIYFITNNSTKTRAQIFDKLIKMGIQCKLEEILTSGYIAAIYLKEKQLNNVYVFGSQNLAQELNEQGLQVVNIEFAENLLIGYDPDITYEKITNAVRVALQAKTIIACNKERLFSGEDAKWMPGCGCMTAPIEWCANRKCDIVVGKPNTLLLDILVKKMSCQYNEILVIGDTYESDIKMAQKAGCSSILIQEKKIEGVESVKCIADIMDLF